jgi:predicted nuclease of predicted toxin-antitoxin system
MRVVVDVNLAPAWAERLRASGYDAQHWSEIGALDVADSEILTWAAEHGSVVTCDLDFGAILAASQARAPSAVQIRARDVLPEAIGDRIRGVLKTTGHDLAQGAIVSVDLDMARIRVLPLDGGESSPGCEDLP